jgi:hypothetical protein
MPRALYKGAMESIVGNRETVMFWFGRWLGGNTVAELATNLFETILRVIKQRTVAVPLALESFHWVSDTKGTLSVTDLRS